MSTFKKGSQILVNGKTAIVTDVHVIGFGFLQINRYSVFVAPHKPVEINGMPIVGGYNEKVMGIEEHRGKFHRVGDIMKRDELDVKENTGVGVDFSYWLDSFHQVHSES